MFFCFSNAIFAAIVLKKTKQGNDETWNEGNYIEGETASEYPSWAPGTISYTDWGSVGLADNIGKVKYHSDGDGLSSLTSALVIKIQMLSNKSGSKAAEIYMANVNNGYVWDFFKTVTNGTNHLEEITISQSQIPNYISQWGRCEVIIVSDDAFVIDKVEFWMEPLPLISLSPSSYPFSNTVANTTSGCGQCSAEKSFTLKNDGGGTATGSVALSDETHFTILSGGGSFSLTSGSQKTIKVKFCPQSTDTKNATLTATGNAPCNSVNSQLTGVGISPTGSKSIIVHNVGGGLTQNATCKLYNSSGSLIDTETTNSSGKATFTEISLGNNYYIKVFYNGTSPYSGIEEWGRTNDFNIICGTNSDDNFWRYLPYGSTVTFSYDAAGTQIITPSTNVSAGSTVYMSVLVKNDYALSLSSKLSTQLDINQVSPYNITNLTQTQTISGNGSFTFQRNFVVSDIGTYLYSLQVEANPYSTSSYLKTDGWNWTPAFNVISNSGTKNIIVHNIGGALIQNATCKLFTSTGSLIDTKTTNSQGVASFTGINPGTGYFISVFYDGISPYPGTEEWGRTSAFNIVTGNNDDVDYWRYLPYGSTVTFSYDAAGTQIITPSTNVSAGSTVYMSVLVKNDYALSLSSKLSTQLDINQVSPYNITNLTQTQTISGNGSFTFQRNFVVSDIGTYLYSLQVEANPYSTSSYLKTDGWNWTPAFNVIAPSQIQTLSYNGENYYINGANIPWNSFGSDVGTHYQWGALYDPIWFETMFTNCQTYGINCLRLWLHCDGRTSPEFDTNGNVTGLDANFFANLDDILIKANNHNIMIIISLWSFDMTKNYTSSAGMYAGLHADLISNIAKTNSYINNALIPMVQRYSNTCNLLAWEVINEPEWSMAVAGGGTTEQTVTVQEMQRFVGMIAKAIHQNCSKMVTVGSASLKWNSDKTNALATPCVGNFWKNSQIQAAFNDPNAYLDFYSIHYFDWMYDPFVFDPFNLNYPYSYWLLDKPTIIGECKGNSIFHTPSQMISNACINQFAGTLFWSINANDGSGTFDDFKNQTKSFRDNNISIVDFDCEFSITLTQPSSNLNISQGTPVSLSWTAAGQAGSTVTLKYDVDTNPNNGNETLITNTTNLSGSTNWLTTGLPDNTYYILGIITSGANSQSDYAPGTVTISSQPVPYNVIMEPYMISDINGAPNSENPGTQKTQFIPGETVRITLRAINTGASVPVRCVLNVRGPDNNTWVYDSHVIGMDNSTDSPLEPAEGYDYYSFDWTIPSNAQIGYYDFGGSIRNFSNFDLVYETTSPGGNSNFNGDNWILSDAFQVINGADNIPPVIEVWRVYQSGDERFRVVAKVTDAGSGVNPSKVKLIFYRLNCTFCTPEHNDMVLYPNYPNFYEGVSDQFDEGDHVIWKIEAKDMAGNVARYPEDLNLMTVQETESQYSDYCGRIHIHDFEHLNDANSFNYLTIPSGAVTFRMDGDDILVKNNTAIWYEMAITPASLNPMAFTTVLTSQMLNPKGGYLPLTLDELVSEENAIIPNAVSVDNITINVDRKSAAAMLRNSMDMILYGIKGINGAMPYGLGGFSGSLSKNDWDDIIDGAFFASNVTDLLLAWLQTNNPPTWEASLYSLQLLLEPVFQDHLKVAIYNKLLQKANDPTFAFGFMGTTVTPIVDGAYDLIQGLQNRTKFLLDLFMYPLDDEVIMLGKASPLKLDESTIPGGFSYQGSQKIYCGQQTNFNLTVNVPPGNVRPYFKTYALIKIYSPQGVLVETTKINDYNFNPTGGLIVHFNGLTDNSQGASWNPLRFNNAIGINVVYSFTTSTTGHQYQSSFKPYAMEVILYQNGLPGINVNPFEPDAEISTGRIPFRIYDNTNPQKPVIAGLSNGIDLYNFGFYLEPADPDIYYYKVYRKFPAETSFTYIDSIRNGNKERLYFYDHFTEPHTNAVYKIQAIDISGNVSTFSDEFAILISTLPPTLFHLTSPTDNQAITSQTPLVSWDASTDPDGTAITYDLYISTNSAYTNPIVITNLFTPSYQVLAPLADNTIYYWKVKAKDAINESRWSYEESWKFAVNLQNEAPGSFRLTEPNQTTVGSLKPTFKWQSSSDPDPFDVVRYTVILATNPSFTNAMEFDNIQSTQYTLSNALNPSTTYYWKVKATDNQNLQTWSTQTNWSFITPALPNASPVLTWTGEQFFEFDGVDPNAGDTLTSFSYKILFKDADGDAPLSGYPRLIIEKNGIAISGSPFTLAQLDNNSFITGRKFGYTKAPMPSGTDYTYYFEARDSKNAVATGEPVQSRFGPDVNYIKVLTPNGGQSLVANQQYSITWVSRGDFEKFFILYSPDNGSTWQTVIAELNPLSASYSWTVPVVSTSTARIKVGGVYSTDTVYDASDNVFSVSILNNAPNPFSLSTPHNTDVPTLNPTLLWNSTTDPNGTVITYELWYSIDSSFLNKTVISGLTSNQYTPILPLIDNTKYYWKVKAIDADGLITWSTQQTWYFIVNLENNGPNAPSLIGPVNGSTLLTQFPQFNWTLVEDSDPDDIVTYELWIGTDVSFSPGTYQVYSNIFVNEYSLTTPANLNTTYYWKVFSVDNHGAKTVSIETNWLFNTPMALPQFSVAPTSLTFESTTIGIHSVPKSYNISGSNLVSSVNITAPSGSLISFDSLENYSNFLTVFPTNGSVAPKEIFVVFAPNHLGAFSDSIINSSQGCTEKKVILTGTGNSFPLITTTADSLNFGYQLVGSNSLPLSYLLSGFNLNSEVAITAADGFQISTSFSSGFTSSLSLFPTGGTLLSTCIYVRFCPTLEENYFGNILHISAGANSLAIEANGIGYRISPLITVSTTNLPSFGNVTLDTCSITQSYVVSGNNLTEDITITAPQGFRISTNSGSGYVGSLTLTNSSGTVTATTIYTKFCPTSAVSYSSSITHTSTGAPSQYVSVQGSGSGIITSFTISGQILDGNNNPIQGVTISFTNLTPETTITDAQGNYSMIVPNNYSGKATPSKLCYSFNPVSITYTNISSNQINPDLIGTLSLLPVGISISTSDNNVCQGTSIDFTATPVNGGSSPGYQWRKNNVNISGATNSTYSYVPLNNDTITCRLTSNADCATGSPATSNAITMVVNSALTAGITISASSNPACAGSVVTFTATPTNGGSSPGYQWKKGGIDVPGATNSTYSCVPLNNEVFTCQVTSNLTCVTGNPANSNAITMSIKQPVPVSVTIDASANGICQGTSVTFTATPVNGGSSPGYQWKKNGTPISGATNSTYIYTPANNDAITCELTSNANCISNTTATSNTLTMTVNPSAPVSISISPSSNPVCSGTSVTFTASPVNGGVSPGYQWKNNNVNINGATNSTYSYIPLNNDTITCRLTSNANCAVGNPATSNAINMSVTTSISAGVSILASTNNVCAGTTVHFTAYPVNGGTSPGYQWKKNGVPVGTNQPTYFCVPQDLDVITCTLTSNLSCASGNPVTSNAVIMHIKTPAVVGVLIYASSNLSCFGVPVTYTAMGSNGGTAPVYRWMKNGITVGSNSSAYSYIPEAGDEITCELTSNATCIQNLTAISNVITTALIPSVPVSVSIIASANPVCSGTPVTFTASSINGGNTPVYQWKMNGTEIGPNSPVFTYAPGDGDVITCTLTSSVNCPTGSPATSNAITMGVNTSLAAGISVVPSANPACQGSTVTFTADPVNGGTAPVYQWKINGINVGVNTPTCSFIPQNNDQVRCEMTSNLGCATGNPALSNTVTMVMHQIHQVTLTVSASANPVCVGSQVIFTAHPVNGGAAPAYQWRRNGIITGTNDPVLSLVPDNNDLITCQLTSSELCTTGNPAVSNQVIMTVNPNLQPGVTVTASENPVCNGTPVSFTATSVNGGSSPGYQWRVNNTLVGTNNPSYTYIPSDNDFIVCDLVSNASCITGNPATSNVIQMSVDNQLFVGVSITVASSTVCIGSPAYFTAHPVNGGLSPVYQWRINGINAVSTGPAFSYIPAQGDKVTCEMTSGISCAINNPVFSNPIEMTTVQPFPVSVSITTPLSTVCQGRPITYTAFHINGGPTPSYQWKVNGINAGTNNQFFTYIPSNGDVISCILTTSLTCVTNTTATSNVIQMTVDPLQPVSLEITPSANPVLPGTAVTFTATWTNGGSSPVFQWKVNGINVGSNSPVYNYTPNNLDEVVCEMTSDIICVTVNPVISNTVNMVVTFLPVGITIASSANNICAGSYIEFTATPVNGGTDPQYQWKVNGIDVGTNSPAYGYTPVDQDVVTCVLTSNAPNVTGNPATSNPVIMIVKSNLPVSVIISPDVNPICPQSQVTLTAVPVNGGTTPFYQWKVNGINSGINNPLFTYFPSNGDIVVCRLTSSEECTDENPIMSNGITMQVPTIIPVSLTIGASANPVNSGIPVTFTANPVNPGNAPFFQWKVNGVDRQNNNPVFSYTPANGDQVVCLMTSGHSCASVNPAVSNTIIMTVNIVPAITVLTPDGGEYWIQGSVQNITWTDNISENVKIELLKGETYYETLVSSTPSTGSWSWTIPADQQVGIDYRIRITSVSDNAITDNSDASFKIMANVVSNLVVQNMEISNGMNSCFDALNTITVAGNGSFFHVIGGSYVTFIAGVNILFMPGTQIYNGGMMHGYIAPTGPFCGTMAPSFINVTAGIEDPVEPITNQRILIYPNPTTGIVTLEFVPEDIHSGARIYIYSMNGSEVLQKDLPQMKKETFMLDFLTPGIYLCRIVYNGKQELIKIVML